MTMKLLTDLQKNINALRGQRREASESLARVQGSIRALLDEALALRTAPAARDDFLKALYAHIDQQAVEGRRRIKETLWRHQRISRFNERGSQVQEGHFGLDHVRSVIDGTEGFGPSGFALLCAGDSEFYMSGGSFDYVGMCTVFGEQMKEAAARNFAEIDWPYPQATPSSVRDVRLAEIEEELRPLRAQEAELIAILEAAEAIARGA